MSYEQGDDPVMESLRGVRDAYDEVIDAGHRRSAEIDREIAEHQAAIKRTHRPYNRAIAASAAVLVGLLGLAGWQARDDIKSFFVDGTEDTEGKDCSLDTETLPPGYVLTIPGTNGTEETITNQNGEPVVGGDPGVVHGLSYAALEQGAIQVTYLPPGC
jgi:hypothetical protein